MCETFDGVVNDLNFKTLRYPWHRDLMKFLLNDLNLGKKQELLTKIFDQEVPLTFNDMAVAYVNCVGNEANGLIQRSFVKKIYAPKTNGPWYNVKCSHRFSTFYLIGISKRPFVFTMTCRNGPVRRSFRQIFARRSCSFHASEVSAEMANVNLGTSGAEIGGAFGARSEKNASRFGFR